MIATITGTSATAVTAIVPKGASTGYITVTAPGGQVTSATRFKVYFSGNDNFINKQTLSGPSGFVLGDTTAATKEAGEPNHAGNPRGHSVWFNWKAPVQASYATFATKTAGAAATGFDTTLAVYQGGGGVTNLTSVTINDNVDGTIYSRVTFPVTPGQRYKVAIDGANGAAGSIELKWNVGNSAAAANQDPPDGYVPPPYYPQPTNPAGTQEP